MEVALVLSALIHQSEQQCLSKHGNDLRLGTRGARDGLLEGFMGASISLCPQEPSPLPVSTATSALATRRTCAYMYGADMPTALRSGDVATLRSPHPAAAPSSLCNR